MQVLQVCISTHPLPASDTSDRWDRVVVGRRRFSLVNRSSRDSGRVASQELNVACCRNDGRVAGSAYR